MKNPWEQVAQHLGFTEAVQIAIVFTEHQKWFLNLGLCFCGG